MPEHSSCAAEPVPALNWAVIVTSDTQQRAIETHTTNFLSFGLQIPASISDLRLSHPSPGALGPLALQGWGSHCHCPALLAVLH